MWARKLDGWEGVRKVQREEGGEMGQSCTQALRAGVDVRAKKEPSLRGVTAYAGQSKAGSRSTPLIGQLRGRGLRGSLSPKAYPCYWLVGSSQQAVGPMLLVALERPSL